MSDIGVSEKERDRRWSLIRGLMEKQGMDGLVVCSNYPWRNEGGYVKYLSNFSGAGYLIFPLEGDPIGINIRGWIQDVRRVPPMAAPDMYVLYPMYHMSPVIEAAKDSKLDKATIGLVGYRFMAAAQWDRLKEKLPNATIKPADDLLDGARMVKSSEEIKLIKMTAKLQDKAFERFCEAAKPGKTEREVYAEVVRLILTEGAHYTLEGGLLLSTSGVPLPFIHAPSSRKLQLGDSFQFYPEYAGPWGYWVHYGRTVSIGAPPPWKMRDVWNKTIEIDKAGIKKMRPGNTAADVCNAIKDAAEEAGYVPMPRPGHAMGLDCLERPWIHPDDKTVLKTGMTVALHSWPRPKKEPQYSFMTADLYLITEYGAKSFNPPQEYRVV